MKNTPLLIGLGLLALSNLGCDGCDGEPITNPCNTTCEVNQYCCQARGICEQTKYNCTNVQSCEPGFNLDHGQGPFMNEETCEPLALTCSCVESNSFQPGILGQYSALAVYDGTLMASGYEASFGDLVFFSAPVSDLKTVTKEIVDGVPDESPTKDLEGWRGGIEGIGDDVGLDTDILILDTGEPVISYRDKTNRSLKFAFKTDGAWNSHTVETPTGEQEIVGRYTDMLMMDGKPAIAYLVFNSEEAPGQFRSMLKWAEARTKVPESANDWQISTIESAPMPCRNLCPADQYCVVNSDLTSSCQKTDTGCTGCTEDEVCVAGECRSFLANQGFNDLPLANGLFPSVALAGDKALVVFYDRVNGLLKAALQNGPTWTIASLDGGDGQDVGAFCSLTVDSTNTAHISYQDMNLLTLKYMQMNSGALVVKLIEVIDDGIRASSVHPVGADSKILFDSAGVIRVIYQDSQNSDLLTAKRLDAGQWMPLDQTNENLGRLVQGGPQGYGFYSDMVLENNVIYGSSFVYDVSQSPIGNLEFLIIQ